MTPALQLLTSRRAGSGPDLVLLHPGDDDEVRFEHVLALYDALPQAELAVVPRATHGVVVEKPALVARLIDDFLAADPSPGFAPIRRAPTP